MRPGVAVDDPTYESVDGATTDAIDGAVTITGQRAQPVSWPFASSTRPNVDFVQRICCVAKLLWRRLRTR